MIYIIKGSITTLLLIVFFRSRLYSRHCSYLGLIFCMSRKESDRLANKQYEFGKISFLIGIVVTLFLGIGGWVVHSNLIVQEKIDTNVNVLFDEKSGLRSRLVAISNLSKLIEKDRSNQSEIIKQLVYFIRTEPPINLQHSNGVITSFTNDDVHDALSVIRNYSSKKDLPVDQLVFDNGNFAGGSFVFAKLQRSVWKNANCAGCNLTNADLTGSDLESLNLSGANIHLADFRGAKNLTVEQITSAKNWQHGKYDDQFSQALGLPLKKNNQPI